MVTITNILAAIGIGLNIVTLIITGIAAKKKTFSTITYR